MNILIGMPCYKDGRITREGIETMKEGTDLFLVDNGAYPDVKEVLEGYAPVLHNEKNIYVNPAWNQIMRYFLDGDWDWLCIASSDVKMAPGWIGKLEVAIQPFEYYTPTYLEQMEFIQEEKAPERLINPQIPGAFMILPREAVEIVYPIPEELVLWFGDAWIYTVLTNLKWKYVGLKQLPAYHHWSVGIEPEKDGYVIENDKKVWESKELQDKLIERVNKYKEKYEKAISNIAS